MKKLLLATTKNFYYRESLPKNGYSITECNLPASTEDLDGIKCHQPFDVCIIEFKEEMTEANADLYSLFGGKTKVLCLADQIGSKGREFLINKGISDLLLRSRANQLIPYLEIMSESPGGGAGTIVVLDDNNPVIGIVSNIIGRFNYTPTPIGSVEELFNSALDSRTRFVLVNLGVKSLDLNGLVRKFYNGTYTGTIPVVVYKDMREGLFVHELVGGLNRLTRFILSIDELFSFLVDILFKKEILPHIASIKKASEFEDLYSYSEETVSRVFFMNEKRFFNQANILNDENFNQMVDITSKIKKSLLMVEGLKWLRIETDKRSSVLGEGGY